MSGAEIHPDVEVATPSRPAPAAEKPDAAPRASLALLCCCAILIGIVTGLGAVLFRDLIGLVHNLMFLGRLSTAYNASLFTPPSPWGPFLILVPVIGGLGVTWLVSNFAPEARGHGVPEVMAAIYYRDGVIRPAVALVKSLASALAIGSGAAVGREGPIIQIGSALGSTLGQLVPMLVGQRIMLVAAGAGAGIAATFNTPIGGVLFATELMLPEISVDSFLPVALATGTATFIGRLFFGNDPAFLVPRNLMSLGVQTSSLATLMLYAVLGIVIGVAAAAFIRVLHLFEDGFDRIRGRYTRHVAGMFVVGVMIYLMQRLSGHYYIEGVGYSTIQGVLAGQLDAASFLLLLFVAKLLATSISLGSGSSGGVFSPSLFMGTAIGAGFAALAKLADPTAPVSLPAFAMVGMGAMVGSSTGAAMTAVTMIFEMTRDYDVVLPMIIAVAVALGTRRLLSTENIYTMKLVRRGNPIPKAMHANMFLVHGVSDLMERDVVVIDRSARLADLMALPGGAQARHAVLTEHRHVVGVLALDAPMLRAMRHGDAAVPLGDFMSEGFITVRAHEVAFDVISMMENERAAVAVVLDPGAIGEPERVVGIITHRTIAASVADSIRLYGR
jgi:CIC family chloride channel protein